MGKKNAPTYRVVVAQTRGKRNGEFLDTLGDFNPASKGKPVIDALKMAAWVKKGALVTDAVKSMVEGTYTYTKYNPKVEKTQAKEDGVQDKPEVEAKA